MPKKLTPYQWKNLLFSYEVIYNALVKDVDKDDDIGWTAMLEVHELLRTRAGGHDGSEATEETDRTSEPDETERGGVAGTGD